MCILFVVLCVQLYILSISTQFIWFIGSLQTNADAAQISPDARLKLSFARPTSTSKQTKAQNQQSSDSQEEADFRNEEIGIIINHHNSIKACLDSDTKTRGTLYIWLVKC